MGKSGRWLGFVPKKFLGSSRRETVIIVHTNNSSFSEELSSLACEPNEAQRSLVETELPRDDVAAIKIQAFFRGHLARRAFRALKSLVKLQALVRGVCVRRQARIAMDCMHALARLQMTIRARQLLSSQAP